MSDLQASEESKARVADLIYREKTVGISDAEKEELDHYAKMEHEMRLAKVRVRREKAGHEDQHDLAVIEKRRNEELISMEELKRKLKKDGLL